MEPLSFIAVLIFGLATGYGIKAEKCKIENKPAQIEQKVEKK